MQRENFHYDTKYFYPEATNFILTGNNLKYLLSILNSKPATLIFKKFYAGGGLGNTGFRYKKAFLENLPIPNISELDQAPFVALTEQILALTQSDDYSVNMDKQKQVATLQAQIDRLVYALYGITDDEVRVIEGA